MDVVLRQMAVTVKKGAVFSRAHVEMQEKVETFTQPLKLQPQPTNTPSMQLATEVSKPSSAFSQSCSETSKISTNSVKRAPLFSPSKFFISDSLKFFWFIKHDSAGKKAKDVRCSEVSMKKHDLNLASDIAIKQENLLDLDSATNIKPLLTPVELSKLGKTKVEIRKTDYVNKAVKNITGWLHSVWSYKRPRKISKGHPNSVAADELYICNGCEQQILSEILRSNNIQIAVRYATPEGHWLDDTMADHILTEEARDCHENGCSVEEPIVYMKHDQESFAKFLHNVPLKEIKTISQLSDLCHLAYIIPKMKVLNAVCKGVYFLGETVKESIF